MYDTDTSSINDTTTSLPKSLVVVAALFFLIGSLAVIEMIYSLMNDRVSLNFNIIAIGVGWGLLKLRSGWRICGMVMIWLVLIGAPLAAALGLIFPENLQINGQPVPMDSAFRSITLATLAAVFAIALWAYRVLTNPVIRDRFSK